MITEKLTFNIHDTKEREQRFMELYEEAFPKVAGFVAHRGGSFQDAKDIFQDSLVIFYEKKVESLSAIEISDEAYLIGIAKHLWIRKFKADKRYVGLDAMEKLISIPEEYFNQENNKLVSILELTGKKCLTLLRAFYYDNFSLERIKEKFAFSTLHSASVQKHKCIEKMRTIVEQKSLGYEDLHNRAN
jgi:DNA-directed RNA polymerase specialized sigma24 family protein